MRLDELEEFYLDNDGTCRVLLQDVRWRRVRVVLLLQRGGLRFGARSDRVSVRWLLCSLSSSISHSGDDRAVLIEKQRMRLKRALQFVPPPPPEAPEEARVHAAPWLRTRAPPLSLGESVAAWRQQLLQAGACAVAAHRRSVRVAARLGSTA